MVQPSTFIQPPDPQILCDPMRALFDYIPYSLIILNSLLSVIYLFIFLVVLNTMNLPVPYSLYSTKYSIIFNNFLTRAINSPHSVSNIISPFSETHIFPPLMLPLPLNAPSLHHS